MKNIIEDLGGIFEPDDNQQPKHNNDTQNNIVITPSTYNVIPTEDNKTWTVYLQFDNDAPVPFAFIPNGDNMNINIIEPNEGLGAKKANMLIFTDIKTNKRLRLFARK